MVKTGSFLGNKKIEFKPECLAWSCTTYRYATLCFVAFLGDISILKSNRNMKKWWLINAIYDQNISKSTLGSYCASFISSTSGVALWTWWNSAPICSQHSVATMVWILWKINSLLQKKLTNKTAGQFCKTSIFEW